MYTMRERDKEKIPLDSTTRVHKIYIQELAAVGGLDHKSKQLKRTNKWSE
jgi:hypothetical protein